MTVQMERTEIGSGIDIDSLELQLLAIDPERPSTADIVALAEYAHARFTDRQTITELEDGSRDEYTTLVSEDERSSVSFLTSYQPDNSIGLQRIMVEDQYGQDYYYVLGDGTAKIYRTQPGFNTLIPETSPRYGEAASGIVQNSLNAIQVSKAS